MRQNKKDEHKDELAIHSIISATTAQPLDLDKILDTALDGVMELFNIKSGVIYIFDPKSNRLTIERQKNITRLFAKEMKTLSLGQGCAGAAAETGKIYCAFAMPEREFLCQDAERLMGIDCFMAAPIYYNGKVIGVIDLFAPSSRRITKKEANTITSITNQIGIAIENARLYQESQNNVSMLESLKKKLENTNRELQEHYNQEAYIAKTLQKGLIPIELPKLEGYEIAVRYISATKTASVGGDFYDFIPLDNSLGIIVGDVSGSGIETATLGSMVKNTLRAFAFENPEPKQVITRTNSVIYKETPLDKFVSVFYALLNPLNGNIIYANAGHPQPFIIENSKKKISRELEPCAEALAITNNITCTPHQITLEKSSSFIVFSDGLTEARRGNDLFGEQRLKNTLLNHDSDSSAENMSDNIINTIQNFSGGQFVDDTTLVIIKRK